MRAQQEFIARLVDVLEFAERAGLEPQARILAKAVARIAPLMHAKPHGHGPGFAESLAEIEGRAPKVVALNALRPQIE